jgi:hypothetical protein
MEHAAAGLTLWNAQASAKPDAKGRNRIVPLWGDETCLVGFGKPNNENTAAAFVEKCARHGVTRLIPSGGSRALVEAAHARKIEVHPYSAFNSHGRHAISYTWSLDYLEMNPALPEARKLLDNHRPIWYRPTTELLIGEFAKAHPQFWSLSRDRKSDVRPGESISLSLTFSEVREYETARYLKMLKTTGGSGVQLEFLPRKEDETKTDALGYEEATASAFAAKHGRDPLTLANDDPGWVQFRADQLTNFMGEFRREVSRNYPDIAVSAVVIATDIGRYRNALLDWPAWVSQKSIDEMHLWFRTTSDPREVETFTKQAAVAIAGRCPLIVELSCYHVGSFQQPAVLMEAARRARGSGADGIGLYRSHAVEQLGFWPVVERIASLA